MGLDFGLTIKGRSLKGKRFLEHYFGKEEDIDKHSNGEFEFFYTRKGWNIRGRILDIFQDKEYDGQGGDFTIKFEDLFDFVEYGLKYFLKEENWEDYGSNLWTWDESLSNIGNAIFQIRRFVRLVEEDDEAFHNSDFDIRIYDSY